MDAKKIIIGAITIIIGLVLIPVMAGFIYGASHNANSTGVYHDDTNVTGISGLSSLINLVLYGFVFAIVGVGVGLIWIGFKE